VERMDLDGGTAKSSGEIRYRIREVEEKSKTSSLDHGVPCFKWSDGLQDISIAFDRNVDVMRRSRQNSIPWRRSMVSLGGTIIVTHLIMNSVSNILAPLHDREIEGRCLYCGDDLQIVE
jgi:hypothetical protein